MEQFCQLLLESKDHLNPLLIRFEKKPEKEQTDVQNKLPHKENSTLFKGRQQNPDT